MQALADKERQLVSILQRKDDNHEINARDSVAICWSSPLTNLIIDWNVMINNRTSKNDFTIVRGRKGYQEHSITSIFTEECFTKVLELFS